MNKPLTIECPVPFSLNRRASEAHLAGANSGTEARTGRVPRVSKFMALAFRFDGLVRDGTIEDFASLARLGHVTRARISQIMSLLHLAPDIQEELLFLPQVTRGRDPFALRDLLPIAQEIDWDQQRSTWKRLVQALADDVR